MGEPAYVVGAYASLPQSRGEQANYYELLGAQPWIEGTELPFPGDLADADNRVWLAEHVPAHWHHNTVTLIPGTMQNVGKMPMFGLASPDENGRLAAIRFVIDARAAIMDLARLRGHNDVAFIEIHSAPTAHADMDAMRRSIAELQSWDWAGTKLVIEHCDQYIDGQSPEKGFLSIDDEIELCREAGIGLTVNWGRRCIEGRNADLPEAHIRQAADAGILHGLMFSGAGPEASQFGYSWIDGHLPMSVDEPTSLMTGERIAQCARVAQESPAIAYVGAKICVPKDSTLDERLMHLTHIYEAGSIAEAA